MNRIQTIAERHAEVGQVECPRCASDSVHVGLSEATCRLCDWSSPLLSVTDFDRTFNN